MTTETNELRVRTVTRFNLTLYKRSPDGSKVVKNLVELPSLQSALQIATSLLQTLPNCTLTDEAGRDYPLRTPTGQHLMASRFSIDDYVIRAQKQATAENGSTWTVLSEIAQVVGVIHHRSKVSYELVFPSGRAGEIVDSDEVSEAPTT